MPAIVRLNSQDYAIRGPVRRYTVQQVAPTQRNDATLKRGSVTKLSQVAWEVLTGGIGKARIRSDEDFRRVWSSGWDTRFPGQVTPGLLATDTADDTLNTPATIMVDWNGTIWAASGHFGTVGPLEAHYFVGSTGRWTDETVDADAYAQYKAYDLMGDGALLYLAYKQGGTGGVTGLQLEQRTTGGVWSARTLTGIDTAYEDSALMWRKGATVYVACEDSSAKSIKVYKSTDQFANVTLITTIQSSSGPKGWATYYNRAGTESILLGTAEGVYVIDETNSTHEELVPIQGHTNNCKRMVVWAGRLYVPVGGDRGGMIECYWDGSAFNVNQVGMNREDGPAFIADILTLWPVGEEWLFAGLAHAIYAMDAKHSWHFIASGTTINAFGVTANDDDTMRLHFLDVVSLKYTTNPLVNPGQTSGLVYNNYAALEFPIFGKFMPDKNGCFLRVAIDAEYTTNGAVDVSYSLDGASYTSLGRFNASTASHTFGSGVGVSGKALQLKLTSYLSASSDYARVFSVLLEYEVILDDIEGYQFDVDVPATAESLPEGVEGVLANLTTAKASVVLVPFAYGKASEVNVRVRRFMGIEQFASPANELDEGERRGIVTVVCEEVMV